MKNTGTTTLGEASSYLARVLNLPQRSVDATLSLLNEGATVPFIARYRKEQTGGLNEEQLRTVQDSHETWKTVESRRAVVFSSLRRQGVLTEDLKQRVRAAGNLQALEDLYLPYRPRRRTRADRAREAGLEPLARSIIADCSVSVDEHVRRFVESAGEAKHDALRGARDIIAADCAVDAQLRARLREIFRNQAAIESRRKKTGGAHGAERDNAAATYRDYFDWREPARACPSHRLLAIFRGEIEGVLRVEVRPPEAAAVRLVEEYLRRKSGCPESERRELMREIALDSYRRLLAPSLETELRNALRERAEDAAAEVFAANLRDLLMAPPLGSRPVLAIDPGFRSGCKVAALDETGSVKAYETIYPLPPQERLDQAAAVVRDMASCYQSTAIAVGSGTGGREVETFIRSLKLLPVVRVNEAGASVYSASPLARAELPDLDVTIRGAVSIGRRLQDPLAELVKIDPSAVGVGQYQHDIDSGRLARALSRAVESCVNAVGVEINTAGAALLAYVSGLGEKLGAAILEFRDENGPFTSRRAIMAVPGFGPRTAEQALGFLRCSRSAHPLDRTGVHPERYSLVEQMAGDLRCTVAELCENAARLEQIDPGRYVSDDSDAGNAVGLLTVLDIVQELKNPGRDPRPEFTAVTFRENVNSVDDLTEGMVLTGIVTNVTKFGAFVDIGVHRDGMIHISRLSDRYVRDPREVVRVGRPIEVTVLAIDRERRRIELQANAARDHEA